MNYSKLKWILIVCVHYFFFQEFIFSSGFGIKYQMYDWPQGLSQDTGKLVMFDNLELLNPMILMYGGKPLFDVTLKSQDEEKLVKNKTGQWGVEGSIEEKPDIYLIDGPANMRVFPEGQIIEQWPDGLPVRLLKSKKEWRLVSNQSKEYGWTHLKNLKKIPNGKILLNPQSKIALELPHSGAAIEKLKTEIDFYIKLKSEGKCPPNITEAEIDGLSGPISNADDSERISILARDILRSEAYYNCTKDQKKRPMSKLSQPYPVMKSQDCVCIFGVDFGYFPEKIPSQEWNTFKKDGCERRTHHFVCHRDGAGEGDVGTRLACPFRCFE